MRLVAAITADGNVIPAQGVPDWFDGFCPDGADAVIRRTNETGIYAVSLTTTPAPEKVA
jgi:hypothetical protein